MLVVHGLSIRKLLTLRYEQRTPAEIVVNQRIGLDLYRNCVLGLCSLPVTPSHLPIAPAPVPTLLPHQLFYHVSDDPNAEAFHLSDFSTAHLQQLTDGISGPPDSQEGTRVIDSYPEFCREYPVPHEQRLQIIMNALQSPNVRSIVSQDALLADLLSQESIRFLFDPDNPYYWQGTVAAHYTSFRYIKQAVLNIAKNGPAKDLMVRFTEAILGNIIDEDMTVAIHVQNTP